jgi:hypothetical protein
MRGHGFSKMGTAARTTSAAFPLIAIVHIPSDLVKGPHVQFAATPWASGVTMRSEPAVSLRSTTG